MRMAIEAEAVYSRRYDHLVVNLLSVLYNLAILHHVLLRCQCRYRCY